VTIGLSRSDAETATLSFCHKELFLNVLRYLIPSISSIPPMPAKPTKSTARTGLVIPVELTDAQLGALATIADEHRASLPELIAALAFEHLRMGSDDGVYDIAAALLWHRRGDVPDIQRYLITDRREAA